MRCEEVGRGSALPTDGGEGEEFALPFSPLPVMLRPARSGSPVCPAHGDLETLPGSIGLHTPILKFFLFSQHVFISYLLCVGAALDSGTKQ